MKLSLLTAGLKDITIEREIEIKGITCDSRQVKSGYAFVCINGTKTDGHNHAISALENGAEVVFVERDLGLQNQIIVEDTRYAYAIMCANWHDNPSKKLKLIGITGTNGKTTITYLIKAILEAAGKKVGLIGTIHNELQNMTIPASHTTPDPMQLHSIFERMVKSNCEYAVLEVSSHALDQQRMAGCHFACAVFTNLTQDHLDYHKTMEAYYQAKKKLFAMTDKAVINMDDDYGQRLLKEIDCEKITFSVKTDLADFTAKNIVSTREGATFAFVGNSIIERMKMNMPGEYSVSNAMAAITATLSLGLPLKEISKGLAACPGVVGRMEIIPTGRDFTVIRDYAHSPDGLEKVITAVKSFAPGRVVVLFGCAGNRDRSKRPKMVATVAKLADFFILTSDNPRDEDPNQIIEDAKKGLEGYRTPYKIEVDRYTAIEWALANARKDDIIILAGKGHEDYQVLSYGTIHFDEKEIVLDLLSKMQR